MFANGFSKAIQYTKPVLTAIQSGSENTAYGIGQYVIINSEGWIVTAAHVVDSIMLSEILRKSERNTNLKSSRSKKSILPSIPSLDRMGYFWGQPGVKLTKRTVDRGADIAIGKLEPFDPSWCSVYPVIKRPDTIKPGTCLLRLAYPFAQDTMKYDFDRDIWSLMPGGQSPVRGDVYPTIGIFSRVATYHTPEMTAPVNVIETSNPSYSGQSGGPMFDHDGNLWSINSQSQSISLNYRVTERRNGKVHQKDKSVTIDVGIGLHPMHLIERLNERGIVHTISDS